MRECIYIYICLCECICVCVSGNVSEKVCTYTYMYICSLVCVCVIHRASWITRTPTRASCVDSNYAQTSLETTPVCLCVCVCVCITASGYMCVCALRDYMLPTHTHTCAELEPDKRDFVKTCVVQGLAEEHTGEEV
jgi:hypothetical protein